MATGLRLQVVADVVHCCVRMAETLRLEKGQVSECQFLNLNVGSVMVRANCWFAKKSSRNARTAAVMICRSCSVSRQRTRAGARVHHCRFAIRHRVLVVAARPGAVLAAVRTKLHEVGLPTTA